MDGSEYIQIWLPIKPRFSPRLSHDRLPKLYYGSFAHMALHVRAALH